MTSERLFIPNVDPAIWRLRPDFIALSIVVRGGRNAPSSSAPLTSGQAGPAAQHQVSEVRTGKAPLASSIQASPEPGPDIALPDNRNPAAPPAWGPAHLDAWRQAYAAFGARPQRTPCSAEALRRRVERDGALPRINAVVDLYNDLSIRYALPIGGEDLAAYRGTPRLLRAAGDERFDTTRDGQSVSELVDAGEVVWRDDVGVTCRRWNWRQSVRTRLEVASTEMWFVLERLEPMPVSALHEAGAALASGLLALAPGARMTTTVIEPSGRA